MRIINHSVPCELFIVNLRMRLEPDIKRVELHDDRRNPKCETLFETLPMTACPLFRYTFVAMACLWLAQIAALHS